MQCLKHTFGAVRAGIDGFENLSIYTRAEVASCLVEASRFPRLAWKRSAVAWAREVMGGERDQYVDSSIAQRQAVVQRLEGRLAEAHDTIEQLLSRHATASPHAHLCASAGHAIVERALNYFQEAHLTSAINALDSWNPSSQPVGLAECAVVFRVNMLRGKILRYQGKFADSLASLEVCQWITLQQHPNSIVLGDELAPLSCELSDVLRELNRPTDAQAILAVTLAQSGQHSASDRQLLSLCLAEVFFAQGRLDEAYAVCCKEEDAALSKVARLRLCVTVAKIWHLRIKYLIYYIK